MSISSSVNKKAGATSNRPAYLNKLLRDAHRLVASGFDAIRPQGLKAVAEEVISERLVLAINGLIEADQAPKWMRRYHAADDLRLKFPGKEGKKRPRVDVEIIFLRNGPRPRFHFEAKRLGPAHAVGGYLGDEGLGCFVNAQYARDSDEGGMLGYVQSDTCDTWAAKLEMEINGDGKKYKIANGTSWESLKLVKEIATSFRTRHDRPTLKKQIAVYHTLLCC